MLSHSIIQLNHINDIRCSLIHKTDVIQLLNLIIYLNCVNNRFVVLNIGCSHSILIMTVVVVVFIVHMFKICNVGD